MLQLEYVGAGKVVVAPNLLPLLRRLGVVALAGVVQLGQGRVLSAWVSAVKKITIFKIVILQQSM